MCVGFLDGSAGNEAACTSRDAGDIGNEVQSLGGEDPLDIDFRRGQKIYLLAIF